jgi:hypothetical protein
MEILNLNLHRTFFNQILAKTKRIEYRARTDYWERRLKGKRYTHIRFRNGYLKIAPEMLVELRKVVSKPNRFELHLGRISQKKNTHLLA